MKHNDRTNLSGFFCYSKQTGEEEARDDFIIPAELDELSNENLEELATQGHDLFDSIYGDGTGLSQDDLDALGSLTEGLERLGAERDARLEASSERDKAAAELAARVRPKKDEDEGEDEMEAPADEDEVEAASDEDEEEDPADEEEPPADEVEEEEEETKRKKKEKRPAMATQVSRSRHRPKQRQEEKKGIKDLLIYNGNDTRYAAGQGIDWDDAAKILSKQLDSFNHNQFQNANRTGKHLRQQMGLATLRKDFPDDLIIKNNDESHINEVFSRATDQKRLPKQSLVAAGGWCAPSETMYDLIELESRDGIYSLPEVQINRGGITRTLGPDFADIYKNAIGFHYTEEQDEAGTYGVDASGDGNDTEGTKPCIRIECPEFEEFRLEVDGICITAGLLMQKAYPELISRTIRGTLIAHDHRMAARVINEVEAGSTKVTMPATEGAIAPVLHAIELQVEQYRHMRRMPRSTTFEAVFPFWVRGLVRADLARREDMSALAITDSQIQGWFASRGISPQFIYNWQDLPDDPTTFTQWPTTLKFLMYPAGTWVRGGSDIITLDTLYDSTLLGNNDYNALFTEEGYLVVKMNHDSRLIETTLSPNGAYAEAVHFEADYTVSPAV